jgi:hypothetical protein
MKKQILSGIRGFSRGLVFVALAAGLVLAACEGITPPDVATEDAASYTVPDAEGRVRVSVKVPSDTARSFTVDEARNAANYYEVIFRDKDAMPGIDTEYYRDSKPKGESLNVRLPIGHHFDILLLAGYQDKRVLLGSAYVNSKVGDDAVYAAGGQGYSIDANEANIINMTITAITVNPETDFVVTYDSTSAAIPIKRNNDAFSLTTSVAAVTAAATALSGANTKLEAIRAKFTTGTSGIKDKSGSIKANTDIDLGSITETQTMRTEFDTANTTLIAKVTALPVAVDLTNVENAILALSPTPSTTLVNAAITQLKAAIGLFRALDSAVIAAINAAGVARDKAAVLSAEANTRDTTNKGVISGDLGNITGDLATINGTSTGSLLAAVTPAKEAVSKTSEGEQSSPSGKLVMAIPKASDATASFIVKISNNKFLPLYRANGASETMLFADNLLTLAYSGQGEGFIGTSVTAPAPTWSTDTLATTYTIDKAYMPDQDVYGVMSFNTIYYPFSKKAGGAAWYIRNGVDNTKVDFDIDGTTVSSTPTGSDRVGGAVFVTIGKGGDPYEIDIPVVSSP